jgi:hypothetical protein
MQVVVSFKNQRADVVFVAMTSFFFYVPLIDLAELQEIEV